MKKIKILLFLSNINQSRAFSRANIRGCVSKHSCSVCPDHYFFARSLCPFPVWNYTKRYIHGSWHYKQDMGRSGILPGMSDSGSVITQIVIPVSWGIVSHLPGRAVAINLGLLAFWMRCHPHMQDVVFHLGADRWVESRPCWDVQRCRDRSFLQNYWDLVPWRMLCQAFGTRYTANLNLEKRRRKNTSLWRWDSGALTSLLSIDRETSKGQLCSGKVRVGAWGTQLGSWNAVGWMQVCVPCQSQSHSVGLRTCHETSHFILRTAFCPADSE